MDINEMKATGINATTAPASTVSAANAASAASAASATVAADLTAAASPVIHTDPKPTAGKKNHAAPLTLAPIDRSDEVLLDTETSFNDLLHILMGRQETVEAAKYEEEELKRKEKEERLRSIYGKDYDLIVESDASVDSLTNTDPLRIAGNHSQGNTQAQNKPLKKAKRRPGTVFLRTYVPRIAMKKIGSDGVCEVFSNGYAIYDNGDRKTVVWVPKCGSTTYYFTKLREHELEYQNEKETIGEDVLGPLPWYMALAIAGENQIEANLERPKSYGTSSDSDDDDEPLKPATHWVAGTRFDNPEDALLRKEEEALVRSEVEKLRPKQKEVIVKYYYEDKTQEEISKEIGKTQSTVNERIRIASKCLEKSMKKYF